MKHVNVQDIPASELMIPGAEKASIRALISPDDAPNFVMLYLALEPGGNTPDHHHEWEEEIFVKTGQGILKTNGREISLKPGDVLLLDPDQPHQFVNIGKDPLEFVCVIPKRS